jgi:hypothetical protein
MLLEIESEATDTIPFTWESTEQTAQYWRCQLSFDNPASIGLFEIVDNLTMSIIDNSTVRGVENEYLYSDREYASVNMPRMININDPSNDWAAFLGKVFLGMVLGASFIGMVCNIFFATNIQHLLSMHIMLQLNNSLPLMRAIPPLYLSYFFHEISMLNW